MDERYLLLYNDIYKYLMKLTKESLLAEELTQETFYKATISYHQFKPDGNLKAWLCAIARNSYYNHLRYIKTISYIDDLEDLSNFVENSVDNVENFVQKNQKANWAHRIVHQLDHEKQEVFFWKVYGELTFKQIADLFGKSEAWAMSTYYRTKRKMLKNLDRIID